MYPWPPKELNPNARVHWAVKSKHAKQMKQMAWAITMQAKPNITDGVRLEITFLPPTAQRFDIDNCLARCKSLIDGISLAIGIDDSAFHISISKGEPITGGAVMVRFA